MMLVMLYSECGYPHRASLKNMPVHAYSSLNIFIFGYSYLIIEYTDSFVFSFSSSFYHFNQRCVFEVAVDNYKSFVVNPPLMFIPTRLRI